MKILFLLSCLFLFTLSSRAQELEPFVNFLRTAPAWVNGSVAFNTESTLYQEGWSLVKINPNKSIDFSFKENWLEVRPGDAFVVRYAGFKVKIITVRWTPQGTETESELPADFTGLSKRKVSAEVAQVIQTLFGDKLRRANQVLSGMRAEKSIAGLSGRARSILPIFASENSSVSIPSYRGKIGFNLLPDRDQAFNLYGMRVGIKEHDHYRGSITFSGDRSGFSPLGVGFESREGVDVNKGKEFKILSRLVIKNVKMDARGMELRMRLGAAELTSAAMWALEMAGGQSCPKCQENAELPGIKLLVEVALRKAVMAQVRSLFPDIQRMNIPPRVVQSYLHHESCRISALDCLKDARGEESEKRQCDQSLRACLR